ncbi:MAG: hypothetical protein SNJ75_16795 [Gemmataceae bacterium]
MSSLHTFVRFLFVGPFLGLCLVTYAAAPPLETDEIKRNRLLIAQLADRDWAVRDAAERQIVAMGLQAVPLLRRAAASSDPEVRRRAMRLLPGLEHALLVQPKRYNLIVVDQPIGKVIELLKNETGYKIESNIGLVTNPPGPDGKVVPGERKFSYHFRNATWWQIIDRINEDIPLQPPANYGDDVVRLYRAHGRPVNSPYVGYDGGIRYVANNISLNRLVEYGMKPEPSGVRTESLLLNLTLYSEPHMPFLGVDQPRLEIAQDDLRGSMVPLPPTEESAEARGGLVTRRYHAGSYKQPTVQVAIPLTAGAVGAKRLALIRGVVPVTLLAAQRPVVITQDTANAKDYKKEIEGIEFQIREVKTLPNNQVQVQINVTNKSNPSDYNLMNTIYQRLELYDTKGTKFQNYGSSWGGGGAGIQLTLTFGNFNAKMGPPAKMIFHHWETCTHEVTFELKDLPLP